MKETVVIRLDNNLDQIQREKTTNAAKVLQSSGADVLYKNTKETNGSNISIEVKEYGMISEVEVRNFLLSLFADKSLSTVSVELKDNERSFQLPDEIEECIDWFIRE